MHTKTLPRLQAISSCVVAFVWTFAGCAQNAPQGDAAQAASTAGIGAAGETASAGSSAAGVDAEVPVGAAGDGVAVMMIEDAGPLNDANNADDSGEGSAGTDAMPVACAPSTVKPDQVVFLGDSFLAAPTSQIAPNLEMLFQESGSSAYSAMPRYHQLVGTTMSQIAAQYDTAHSQNPDIKVVIMDGGGNDVLVTDQSCLKQAPPANQGCQTTIVNALAVADKAFDKMEADGVEHVVFFFYPHEPPKASSKARRPQSTSHSTTPNRVHRKLAPHTPSARSFHCARLPEMPSEAATRSAATSTPTTCTHPQPAHSSSPKRYGRK